MKHPLKYIFAFFGTVAIFVIAWFVSDTVNEKKFTNLKNAQDQISIDILSSETQFDLLKEGSCEDTSSVFSKDLATLSDKIAYSEQNVATPEEINTLKKQYTLLQVRDFLLTKRVSERCGYTVINIFYFYGTKEGCPDCVRQGYVLDALRQSHPDVHVYSFDYNLDLDTVKALIDIYKIGDKLPAVVIGTTTFNGFQSLEDLKAALPKPAK